MTGTRARRDGAGLEARLAALEEATELADGRLAPADVARARALVGRAGHRLRLGLELTVTALAGATGSGKSSLFNALAQRDLAEVGVRRPTTGRAQASVWGAASSDALLDWVGAYDRHRLEGDPRLDGLVLLDLPDHDSTEESHRIEVDRLVELVDLLVWVVDPQKYADAALHERYLRPLATHARVMLVVLNRADELDADGLDACLVDLRRLLDADGLDEVRVLATSARTGEGVDSLRAELAARVAARRAAVERLEADTARVTASFAATCSPQTAARIDGRDRDALLEALAGAAGVDVVADAVGRAHRFRAAAATGWPLTRWLRRLRPDPLRRWHLDEGGAGGASSLPPPSPVQRARVSAALRRIADASGAHLAEPWRASLRRAALDGEDVLPERLDRAVTSVELLGSARPRWWAVFAFLQWLFLGVALAGLAWLAVLFVIAWLRLPDPPTPEIGAIPWPTALLLGGLLAGLIAAAVARLIAGVGARRRRRAARRRLLDAVAAVADERVLAPVAGELEAHERFCAALRRASDGALARSRRTLREVVAR